MRKITVMIVDDQPFFRSGVRDVLARANSPDAMEILECDAGENGNEAIAQIAAASPDIALLDIGYPFLNGLDLCKKIVRTFPQTKVVILSANSLEDGDELFEVIKTGAVAYIRSKYCSPAEFTEILERTSRDEYPINDSVGQKPKVAWRVLRQFQEMTSGVRKDDDILIPLTSKEAQILTLVAEGNANKQIAIILGISEQTIKNRVSSILRKLNANDRAHAVMLAMRNGWVPIQPDRRWGRRRGDTSSERLGPSGIYSN
jgi:DNA-binding NarL/FixJ family response regulator